MAITKTRLKLLPTLIALWVGGTGIFTLAATIYYVIQSIRAPLYFNFLSIIVYLTLSYLMLLVSISVLKSFSFDGLRLSKKMLWGLITIHTDLKDMDKYNILQVPRGTSTTTDVLFINTKTGETIYIDDTQENFQQIRLELCKCIAYDENIRPYWFSIYAKIAVGMTAIFALSIFAYVAMGS